MLFPSLPDQHQDHGKRKEENSINFYSYRKEKIKDGEIFVEVDEPTSKEDKEAVILKTMQYVDGTLNSIDRYEIKTELGKLYEYIQSNDPRADTLFANDLKQIGKKIIDKEIKFAKKKEESRIKTGKILTRQDKLKFLKSL